MLIVTVFVALSGCTSNSETKKTYNGNNFSFDYPASWTLSFDKGDHVKFETPNGEARVLLFDNVKYPASYENWVDEKIGNISYKKLPATLDDGLVSYAIIEGRRDLVISGVPEDEEGHELILESVTIK